MLDLVFIERRPNYQLEEALVQGFQTPEEYQAYKELKEHYEEVTGDYSFSKWELTSQLEIALQITETELYTEDLAQNGLFGFTTFFIIFNLALLVLAGWVGYKWKRDNNVLANQRDFWWVLHFRYLPIYYFYAWYSISYLL